MRLDDQLVVRMKAEMRAAIRSAAEASNLSEGSIVRRAVDIAIENGYLQPSIVFAAKKRVRDHNQEDA